MKPLLDINYSIRSKLNQAILKEDVSLLRALLETNQDAINYQDKVDLLLLLFIFS